MFNRLKRAVVELVPGLGVRFSTQKVSESLRLLTAKDTLSILDIAGKRAVRINRSNSVFTADMVNYFDYFFDSVEPISVTINGERYAIADFSTSRYHSIKGFSDFPVLCPTITEPFVTAQQYLDVADLKSGDTVIDLGAYCGLTAICFSKAVGQSGHVVAVEPDPISFDAAAKNLELHARINGLENVSLLMAAAAATTGHLQFSSEGTMGSADISIVGQGRGNQIEVKALTLLEIAQMHGIEKLDFMKIDIEGSERDLLAGSRSFFEKYRPKMVIEPHIVDGTLVTKSVIDALESYSYECETIEQFGVDIPLIVARPVR